MHVVSLGCTPSISHFFNKISLPKRKIIYIHLSLWTNVLHQQAARKDNYHLGTLNCFKGVLGLKVKLLRT